jgi:tubulin polyglutamylase TTLL6/13
MRAAAAALADRAGGGGSRAPRTAVVGGGALSVAPAAAAPAAKKPKPRKLKKSPIYINLTNCKYDVVFECAAARGWRSCSDDDKGAAADWNVYWTDTSVAPERVMRMAPYQKINHFPGMSAICRKAALGRNVGRMQLLFPREYAFFPRTWVLPEDWSDFQAQFAGGKGNKTFIVKPDNACQGKGIFLTRRWEDVAKLGGSGGSGSGQGEALVAQRYIHRPLLIDGFKFDLRIYALVLCCAPLRVALYDEGLVRLCTEKYAEPTNRNLGKSCVHLTNYAINKYAYACARSPRLTSTFSLFFLTHDSFPPTPLLVLFANNQPGTTRTSCRRMAMWTRAPATSAASRGSRRGSASRATTPTQRGRAWRRSWSRRS